ncbi:MAG: adenylate kinase family protein [Candidatus Micrarchaeota archaeon]
MRILITGTPGTGKSAVASEIARKKGWGVLSLRELAERAGCITGEENGDKIVDVRKLRNAALRELEGKRDAVVEGHLGCEFSLPVDFVFVLRTHPSELRKRMVARGYPGKKTEENLMAEMLDYCTQAAERNYGAPVLEVDTTKSSAEETAGRIISFLEGKVKTLDKADWSKELRKKVLWR